jgi:hypothetical protein
MTEKNGHDLIFQQAQGKAEGFMYTHEREGERTCRVMVLIPEGNPQYCLFQVFNDGEPPGACLSVEKAADFIRGPDAPHIRDALRASLMGVVKVCLSPHAVH